MKKCLLFLILTLLIAGSMLAGTLAYYTTTIDELAAGSVMAKEFIFLGSGTDSFQQGAKIAPAETIEWPFTVKNFDGNAVTETDLYYRLTLHVTATEGKEAIAPLEVSIKESGGDVIDTVVGTGTFDLYGEFPLAEQGQEQGYVVVIHWPEGGASDMDYAGESFGNTIRVSAVARQLPFNIPDPDDPPDPEPQSDIHVLYETTTVYWQTANFRYKITIANCTEYTLDNWRICFSLPTDRITSVEATAREDHEGMPEGSYSFYHPEYNSINIGPNESVSFGGLGVGWGQEPIQNVLVNGSIVELECSLGANR